MRLRDIDRPGCYGGHTSGCVHPRDNDESGPEQNGIHISMINVASFALLAIVPLARFAQVPIITTEDAEDCTRGEPEQTTMGDTGEDGEREIAGARPAQSAPTPRRRACAPHPSHERRHAA